MAEKAVTKKKKKKPGSSGKKKLLLLVVAPLTLLVAVFVLALSMGWLNALMGIGHSQPEAELSLGKPSLVELPEIRTDMKTGACRSPFLRAVVQVQVTSGDEPKIEQYKSQIMDGILTHLRDQERQNVVGKEGSERLRFELVQIVKNVIKPTPVHTVLFKELIVQ